MVRKVLTQTGTNTEGVRSQCNGVLQLSALLYYATTVHNQ
jgi:hypothetical protein